MLPLKCSTPRMRMGSEALLVACLLVTVASSTPHRSQTEFAIVHAFDRGTDGAGPQAPLIQARDGSFYGTTGRGGVYGWGSIYRVTPDGTETVLHSFDLMSDGSRPSPLIEGTDGTFYGTTPEASTLSGPFGFIFQMTPDGTFTTLHAFTCGADGASPSGALVEAIDGNFYGTTAGLSSPYCSAPATLFRLTPDGSLTTLHQFRSSTEGTEPTASLIEGRDGRLYGTARYGGPAGGGTVFSTTTEGDVTVLHAFHYPDDAEGREPLAAVMEASDGLLYGTTTNGGLCRACGTVFRVSPDGTAFEVLYFFENGANAGTAPAAPLIQGQDGRLYGTTASLRGAVFALTMAGGITVLHAFDGESDGANPRAALLQTADGTLYGTAGGAGPAGTGTVFQITSDGAFTVLYSFPGSAEGASPSALIEGADGLFYGTAQSGGTFNQGTVFQLTLDGTTTTLHTFEGAADGGAPSTLVQAEDRTLYGLTTTGGPAGGGTFFQLTADGAFTVLEAFAADPMSLALPSTGLLQARDESIYGAASRGGDFGRGVVFRWTVDVGFVELHSFSGGTEGRQPTRLIQASDGTFYGTTSRGGPGNQGAIFRLSADGTLTTVHDFDGGVVSHGLIEAADGNFYLTSSDRIVRLTPDGMVTVIHVFSGSEGNYPQGLLQASDGLLYGAATFAGSGTVFAMTLEGQVTVLHTFSYPDAWDVYGVPIQAHDGYLYGTTKSGGGAGKAGIVYRQALADQSHRKGSEPSASRSAPPRLRKAARHQPACW